MLKFSQEGYQNIFFSLEHGHMLPAVNSGPDKSVPHLMADHRRSCLCDLLEAALGDRVVCCKFVTIILPYSVLLFVPVLVPKHCTSNCTLYLHLYLCEDDVLGYRVGLLKVLFELLFGQLAGVHSFMKLFQLPGDQVLQGGGL